MYSVVFVLHPTDKQRALHVHGLLLTLYLLVILRFGFCLFVRQDVQPSLLSDESPQQNYRGFMNLIAVC
jgi:hypothetical protein